MSEAGSESKRSKSAWNVDWSNLPQDLLSRIANGLGLIDLLRFRLVCKEWHIASSKPTPEYKPSKRDLWFLTYGEGSQCSLVKAPDDNTQKKIYTLNFPELDGAACLASHLGWLLLFLKGSMFFFCPLSRAKIELPNCPFTELTDHIAAFSSDPTSQDCTVAVVSRKSDEELELHLLCRGKDQWSKHSHPSKRTSLSTIRGAVFSQGEFQFSDRFSGLATFGKTKKWKNYRLVQDESVTEELEYNIDKNMFGKVRMDIYKKLGLEGNNNDVSVCTCGTLASRWSGKFDCLIQSESIGAASGPKSRHLRGVWIQPRYIPMPPGQSW